MANSKQSPLNQTLLHPSRDGAVSLLYMPLHPTSDILMRSKKMSNDLFGKQSMLSADWPLPYSIILLTVIKQLNRARRFDAISRRQPVDIS